LADCSDCATDKVDVDFGGVFFEFHEELVYVFVVGEFYHDVEFFVFEVVGIIKPAALGLAWLENCAYEYPPFLAENVRLLLQDQTDVSECDILYFRSRRYHRNCHKQL